MHGVGRWQPGEMVDGEELERSRADEGPCQECAAAKRQRPPDKTDRSLRPHVAASVHSDLPATSLIAGYGVEKMELSE